MATYFFIGDGTEVLGCESRQTNAIARRDELQAETTDDLRVYECDPCEITQDDAGKAVWANPSERARAEAEYDLPTLEEVIARETADA